MGRGHETARRRVLIMEAFLFLRRMSSVGRFRSALGLIMLGLLAWLIFGADKPWEGESGSRERWRTRDFVRVYSFWAGALNLAVLGGLAASARWWARPMESSFRLAPPAGSRWFWPLVAAAMLFFGGSAAQRMNFGFAHDEDYSARRVIAGQYEVGPEGRVSLKVPRWEETFFYYRKPNNHPLHSILARLSFSAWRLVAPPVDWHMREWVVRLPALMGGLGVVGMLAVLLRRVVSPRAGIVAAWLLALHPWLIRYASEARGYSLLMALIPTVLMLWLYAVRENRWRWWLALAAAELALVYCYPGAVYVLFVLNLPTLGWLILQARKSGCWTMAGRWFASNCFAGVAAVQLMLPMVPQLQLYMQTDEARQPLTFEWQYNTASHFLSGAAWTNTGLFDSPYSELMPYAARHPVFFGVMVAALLAAGIFGYIFLFRQKWPDGPIVAATLLLPGFLGFVMAKILYQALFEWYLIYLLPGLVAGIAVGVDRFGDGMAARFRGVGWGTVPAILLVAAYAMFSQPFRHWYCSHPLEPVKEATLAIRGTLDPNDPRHASVLTGILLGKAWYYDPHATHLKTAEEFVELLRTADAQQKPLYVMVPHPWAAVFKTPQLWRLFNEAGLFADYRHFQGFDQTHDRVVARYVPGAVRDFDLPAFLRGREAAPDPRQKPLAHPGKPEIFP